ncbi:SGNH/GDSL hydrolase family protein [Nonomuraea sp. SBT364]|uniref:SGNH/GDSL hydrolase family protein n=1 Tax=Nonomuraea sp. SBT364 TaxID=1580530 RepID=UPI001E331FFC|nr:SGNH/GDSL hydrolase family protein [Nonomuraea sp. SBT364]
MDGFARQSIRQVIRISTGGSRVRIRLANLYGTRPLSIAGATIAKQHHGAATRRGTMRSLRFGGLGSTTLTPGQAAVSDATTLVTAPLEHLVVTLYVDRPSGAATFHQLGLTTTYRAAGDHLHDEKPDAFFGPTSDAWYYLTGVDVVGKPGPAKGTIVALGDSITDGAISTPNTDNRYPDELAERLAEAGTPMGVANAGINGNMLLTDSPCFGGDRALARFSRDVLHQPGVRTVIVLLGINDIGGMDVGCGTPSPATAPRLITGYRSLIASAHARGVRVVGATITPFKGHNWFGSDRNLALRETVNTWIRSGEFDAVIDLDKTLADPANLGALLPAYDSGDHLHPNDAGMTAIAAAIDLRTL